jgi:hypothetical protein
MIRFYEPSLWIIAKLQTPESGLAPRAAKDEALFKVALETRNFEISMFWQRSNYFLVLNSALAVGFFSQQSKVYAPILALLGMFASLLWIGVNLGGKYWQSRWEHELVVRERQLYPDDPLFGASPLQRDQYVSVSLSWNNHGILRRWWDKRVLAKPSVSASMTYLSACFLLAWIGLLVISAFESPLVANVGSREVAHQMTSSWPWLESNVGAIQSIAALVSAALAAMTIVVLVVTWRSIKRQAVASEEQAEAARALTQVAKEQTAAALDAAQSAKRQSELLSSQIEQSTAPLLVVELDPGVAPVKFDLVNRGPGVAFQIFFWIGPLDLKDQDTISIDFIQPSTLGPGGRTRLPLPPVWDAVTIRYKGIDRAQRWTIFYNDRSKPQEHVVAKGLQTVYLS